ncbi:MAG: glycine--tRNA ligase subunit beta [Acidobacteria bacterium]|nr:glycine--tRNA ligase subunit beta [Acidobacteriota bacterium]
MERELLIEIGCEELPASWLAPLTAQLGDHLGARLREFRLEADAPVEAFSTPRRLTVFVSRIAERQTDLEETITGPPVSAATTADGSPTPAALGFARKHGVEVADLARVDTPKGAYLAFQKRHRGKTAVDVLPDLLAATLRDLAFPKMMSWDAWLDDGRGAFPFGRPIRWLLFLYGGRVVPFTIRRTTLAASSVVQDVRSGAVTYGHRFLTTSGRPGRAIKVRSFADYRSRLAENCVVLDRRERHDRLARELDAHARRLGGRVYHAAASQRGLLDEVANLVEYPAVVAGTFAPEFLDLPEEVLTTTMIHHQHNFPIVDDGGALMPAFLAVTNIEVDHPKKIAVNAERVLAARLRDARFFWEADRAQGLEARLPRLETILFHKRLGSYRQKADRVATLATWLAGDVFGVASAVAPARRAGLLAKVDLATDMVREFTELQGTMGGIYARAEGESEAVWKAIALHYLPVGVEATLPPSREQLGAAAVTWAALALADKLDSVVGLFAAGERPTGTRDPFGIRRQLQGALKLLVDLPETTGLDVAVGIGRLTARAASLVPDAGSGAFNEDLLGFVRDRLRHLFGQRGFRPDEIEAALGARADDLAPLEVRRRLEALRTMRASTDFEALAALFKRVKNIAREVSAAPLAEYPTALERDVLTEDAERALVAEFDDRAPRIEAALSSGDLTGAMAEASKFRASVDRFFTEVFVMVDDERLRASRLMLMVLLRDLVLGIADISQLAATTE